MAGQYTLRIEQGVTFARSIAWKDSDGTPIDVTGYSAALQIRDKAGGTKLYLTLSSSNGGITIGNTDGLIRLFASAAATSALTFSTGRYDLELTAPSGEVFRLIEGPALLSWQVTSA